MMFFLFSLSASFPPMSETGRLTRLKITTQAAITVAFRPSLRLRISVNMGQIMAPMLVMILPMNSM